MVPYCHALLIPLSKHPWTYLVAVPAGDLWTDRRNHTWPCPMGVDRVSPSIMWNDSSCISGKGGEREGGAFKVPCIPSLVTTASLQPPTDASQTDSAESEWKVDHLPPYFAPDMEVRDFWLICRDCANESFIQAALLIKTWQFWAAAAKETMWGAWWLLFLYYFVVAVDLRQQQAVFWVVPVLCVVPGRTELGATCDATSAVGYTQIRFLWAWATRCVSSL